jgi:hypothetical protein
MEWAGEQAHHAAQQQLPAEQRQMEKVVADCTLMLQEMDLIDAARTDQSQLVRIEHMPGDDNDAKACRAGVANNRLGAKKDGNGRPHRKGGNKATFGWVRGDLFKHLRRSSGDRWDFHITQHD